MGNERGLSLGEGNDARDFSLRGLLEVGDLVVPGRDLVIPTHFWVMLACPPMRVRAFETYSTTKRDLTT